MELSDFCNNYDFEMMSVESDEYDSAGSSHSSPSLGAVAQAPQQPAAGLIAPSGHHLELTPVEKHLNELAEVSLLIEEQAVQCCLMENTTIQRRLIKWSLPPPPVHSANLPGWSRTP